MGERPGGENDAPREDVEARRVLARRFLIVLIAQARALNLATRSGPLARVTPPSEDQP